MTTSTRSAAYVWQQASWPAWQMDMDALSKPLERASKAQGILMGRMRDLGMDERILASVTALTSDVVKSNEIEGERLNAHSVRSSIARRLGVDVGAIAPEDRSVEGVVDMVLDATLKFDQPLTKDRLFAWHMALFPQSAYRLRDIQIGQWRNDANGPMQVVSGRMNHERVHYEAPPAGCLETEVQSFLDWVNQKDTTTPDLLRAGLGHLWFVTVHPFDDGNGRIARAIGDMLLARADQSSQRFYSLSAQIMRHREDYYEILERTQKGSLDVTQWLVWFLQSLEGAIEHAHRALDLVLTKSKFWQAHSELVLNARQKRVLNKVLDHEFEGKLTNKKWQALAKTTSDTSLRDITELVKLGVLEPQGAGRGVHYLIRGFFTDDATSV